MCQSLLHLHFSTDVHSSSLSRVIRSFTHHYSPVLIPICFRSAQTFLQHTLPFHQKIWAPSLIPVVFHLTLLIRIIECDVWKMSNGGYIDGIGITCLDLRMPCITLVLESRQIVSPNNRIPNNIRLRSYRTVNRTAGLQTDILNVIDSSFKILILCNY